MFVGANLLRVKSNQTPNACNTRMEEHIVLEPLMVKDQNADNNWEGELMTSEICKNLPNSHAWTIQVKKQPIIIHYNKNSNDTKRTPPTTLSRAVIH